MYIYVFPLLIERIKKFILIKLMLRILLVSFIGTDILVFNCLPIRENTKNLFLPSPTQLVFGEVV